VAEQEVDGAAEVARGALHRQLLHELAGLVGVVGGGAAVEVGCERDEALRGEPVGHVGDVARQPPPLLDHDDAGSAPCRGDGEVTVGGAAAGGERDVLQWVLGHARHHTTRLHETPRDTVRPAGPPVPPHRGNPGRFGVL
jgi:hypothetical protein